MKIQTTEFGELAFVAQRAKRPLIQSFEWVTDVIQANDSTEERFDLRGGPKVAFAYAIPVQPSAMQEVFNTVYGNAAEPWLIPLWSEIQQLGPLTAGATSIDCNTLHYRFPQGLALLLTTGGEWQVLEVSVAVESVTGELTTTALDADYADAWLAPAYKGFLNGSLKLPSNGYSANLGMQVELDAPPDIAPESPATYLGDDIYFTGDLSAGGGNSGELVQQRDTWDSPIGVTEWRSVWERPQYVRQLHFVLEDREAVYNHLRFLYRRKGMYRAFWMPTYEHNLRVKSTGTVVTSLLVESDSYIESASLRTHIAIEAAGVWYARAITLAVQTDATTVTLTLSSAVNVLASKITRVSYLGLNRLNTDKIDISYQGAAATCTIEILEIQP